METLVILTLAVLCVVQQLFHYLTMKRVEGKGDDLVLSLIEEVRKTVELALADQHKKLDKIIKSRSSVKEAIDKARSEQSLRPQRALVGLGNRRLREPGNA